MANPVLICITSMRALLLWNVKQPSLIMNCQSTLLNIAEERGRHLRHGGSLK